jgi:hypothetical protein
MAIWNSPSEKPGEDNTGAGGAPAVPKIFAHSRSRVCHPACLFAGQASVPNTRTLAPIQPGRERSLKPALCHRAGFRTVTTMTISREVPTHSTGIVFSRDVYVSFEREIFLR